MTESAQGATWHAVYSETWDHGEWVGIHGEWVGMCNCLDGACLDATRVAFDDFAAMHTTLEAKNADLQREVERLRGALRRISTSPSITWARDTATDALSEKEGLDG